MKIRRKLLSLFCTAALVCALGVACNDDDEGLRSVSPSREISDFFKDNVGRIAQSVCYKESASRFIDSCVMINSAEKLPKADQDGTPFDFEYPTIDFDTHTLVIGQWERGGSSYLISRNLVVEQKSVTLNLVIGQKKDKGYTNAIEIVPFWVLYPKITAETIYMNYVFK